nr:hypothetical protein [uncultured Rhodopila sp.]
MPLSLDAFGRMLDETGLPLTDAQKSVLFDAYPMFQAMLARATAPLPREAEPAVVFDPDVR